MLTSPPSPDLAEADSRRWTRRWQKNCPPPCRWFRLRQPLGEKLYDALARLVGGLAVDLTNLVGQHRMRHPREPALIAWARIDFDDLERVAELVLERLESFARRHLVFAEPQADGAESVVGGAVFEGVQLQVAHSGIALVTGGQ